MGANLRKSDAAWKRLQSRAKDRPFANRSDAAKRSGATRKDRPGN